LNWRALFDSTKALAEKRDEFETTLRTGYILLRDLEILQEVGAEGRVANIDILPHLKTWAPQLGFRGLERFKEALDQAFRLQVRNVNQQLGLETLAVNLTESRAAAKPRPR
jgi:hypothetical protein